MVNILLISPMMDAQSGLYLHDSFIAMGHKVAYFDWKALLKSDGETGMNRKLISVIEELKPDFSLVIKGIGIKAETINEIRKRHNHYIAGWNFDVTIGGHYLREFPDYVELLKSFDKFYTIDNDAVPELKEKGVDVEWLSEGCHLTQHKEQIINSFQKRKYGGDVVFLGAVGGIHPNREKFLKRIFDEGFPLKLYGHVLYAEGTEPVWVKDCHTGLEAINDYHSIVCQSSKVVIGIDGWPHRSKSYSARLYRTLCPGAVYLNTYTKDIEKEFEIGKHLETFKDEDELIEKLKKLLSDDDLREKMAEAGKKEVIEKHQFKHRLQRMIDNMTTDIKKPKDLNNSNDYILK